jgi:hypothetical protein
VPDPLLAAVLCALAGVRRGDRVRTAGVPPLVAAALLSGAEAEAFADGPPDVVVAAAAFEVPGALEVLAPGGRLVAVAADPAAAARVSRAAGLVRLHVVPLGTGVAWSAVRPLREDAGPGVPSGDGPGGRDIVPR